MSQVIREFNVMSCARVGGLVYALLGFVGGLMFTFFAILGSAASAPEDEFSGMIGLAIGIGAVIFMPLFYGFIGFLFGGLSALAYNFIAGFMGGIEVTLENKPETSYAAHATYPANPQVPA